MGQQVNNHNTAYAIGDFINRHYSTLVTLIDTDVVAASMHTMANYTVHYI